MALVDSSNAESVAPAQQKRTVPTGKMPYDVEDMIRARARLMKGAADPAIVAFTSTGAINSMIEKYPGQILLHVLAIRNHFEARSLRPGVFARNVAQHITAIEHAHDNKTPQLWAAESPDIKRCGYLMLDLAAMGRAKHANTLLTAFEPLFRNPGALFSRTYEALGRTPLAPMPPTKRERRRALVRRIRARRFSGRPDRPTDVWGGYECERPNQHGNTQWNNWMATA